MAIDANIIKIKRSGTSGAPASLKLGELAYSYLTASGNPTSNGGDRLFIGANGVNGGTGNANDVIVIGGKYFTDLLDHERGILTASSALVVDADKKLDDLLVGNLELTSNTLSTTSGDLNVILSANGTGKVQINTSSNSFTLPAVRTATTGHVLTANTDGTTSWLSPTLSIAGSTGTDTVTLVGDTLTFAGATSPITVAVTDNTVTVAVADATASTKGLASFDSTDFTVASGAVTVKEERIQDIVGAMVSGTETDLLATYDDPAGTLDFTLKTVNTTVGTFGSTTAIPVVTVNGKGLVTSVTTASISTSLSIAGGTGTDSVSLGSDTLTFAGNGAISTAVTDNQVAISVATATSSVKGVASFDSTDFTVTTGAVTVNVERIEDIVGAMVSSNTESGISVTYTDNGAGNGVLDFNVNDPVITIAGDVDGYSTMTNLGDTTITVTLDTVNTNVGTFGSTTLIPVVTVNGKGLVTAVTTASISTTLNIAGDTGTDGVALGSDTLTFAGSGAISTAVTDNQIAISVATATSSIKGVSTFNTSGFVVTGGDVALKADVAQSISGDTGSATPATNAFTIAGTSAQGIVTSATGSTVTVTASNATSSQKGVATFNTASFSVSSGDVTIKSGGVTNTQLVNSKVTVGTTDISLGSTSTTLAGLTQIDVNNIRITGNTVSSTDTNGDIVFDPNGTGTINASSSRITNLSDPTGAQDAATKAYVDATRSGLDVKASVRAATTANITLTNTQTIDDVALAVGNRVLVKNQSTGENNGIYVVASGPWTRAEDCDNAPGVEVTSGMFTFVEEGTTNADSGWVLTTDGTITLGTTSLSFVQFSGAGQITAGAGLSKTGNTLDVNVANGIEISGDNVQLASTVAGAGLTYTSGVLDIVGTSNRITVNADSIDISASYVGQNTITTLGTVTTGTWSASTIATTRGGTGLTSYATGDLLYSSASDTLSKLTKPSATSLLTMNSAGAPTWAALTDTGITGLGTVTLGTWNATVITAQYGGTGVGSYSKGDLLYAGSTGSSLSALTVLAAGTNGQTLQLQNGVPVWADLDGGSY
jgi:hypothetical protein